MPELQPSLSQIPHNTTSECCFSCKVLSSNTHTHAWHPHTTSIIVMQLQEHKHATEFTPSGPAIYNTALVTGTTEYFSFKTGIHGTVQLLSV